MPSGTIILINGTSSSGKSSIVKALQEQSSLPYLDAGLDRFLWMLPLRYLDRPLWDDVLGLASSAGQTGHTLVRAMHRAIVSLSYSGMNVVADHVLVEPDWVRDCATLLCELPAFLIGVRCPLAVLEERERSRRDRTLGQAKAQFALVHAHDIYDLEVDTSLMSAQECAAAILARVNSGEPPTAFYQLRHSAA
jgi:chloramphenicol 3-O phosphotransferase